MKQTGWMGGTGGNGDDTRGMIRGRKKKRTASWMAGWTAGRLGACARVARGRQTEYPPVSPTLGTFVNPFVRLILISPSQLRKTTAAFLRARRLPHTSPIGLSHARLFLAASLSLLPSISLFLPSLSPPPSPPLFLMDSTQHPSLCTTVEVTRYSCFPLARSRALVPLRHSSCSFRTLSRAVYPLCIRLSPPPSSYNLILSRGAAILPRPKRRHTYARFPLLLIPYTALLLLVPAVSYADSRQRILFRSIMPRIFCWKIRESQNFFTAWRHCDSSCANKRILRIKIEKHLETMIYRSLKLKIKYKS